MGQSLVCHHSIRWRCLSVEKASCVFIETAGHFSSFRKSPGQIFVAVFVVAFSFLLAVAGPTTGNLPALRGVIANFGKSLDCAGLKHNG